MAIILLLCIYLIGAGVIMGGTVVVMLLGRSPVELSRIFWLGMYTAVFWPALVIEYMVKNE